MIKNEKDSSLNVIKALVEANTTQAKIANRLWLVLIFLSLIILIPRPEASKNTIQLPFDLGSVEPVIFSVMAVFLVSVLIIAFCQAHAHGIRALFLAHRVLDKMRGAALIGNVVYPRDFFDALRTPALSHVASLPQLARGNYQFYPESSECPLWLRVLTTVYYMCFKCLVIIVYYLLPLFAISKAVYQLFTNHQVKTVVYPWIIWLAAIFSFFAFIALFQTIIAEVKYVSRIVRFISSLKSGKN